MGAKSGNTVKQYGLYAGFSASTGSGAIASTTSASVDLISKSIGSSKGKGEKSKYELEREELLSTKIKKACVGWCPLDNRMPGIGFKISKTLTPLKASVIPGNLGGGIYFYHATLWVCNDYEDGRCNEICIEYGMYNDDGTDEYNTPVHYWKRNGLRFGRADFYDWKTKIIHFSDEYSNKGDYVNTEINGNEMTVKELLEKCCEYNPFQSSNYAATSNNCQDFVDRCIRILRLKRTRECLRGFHIKSKIHIPNQILTAFEYVENDIEAYIGKVPVVGPVFDICHGIKRKVIG